jgi:hypothetical protein
MKAEKKMKKQKEQAKGLKEHAKPLRVLSIIAVVGKA